jgi:hypothetical protein
MGTPVQPQTISQHLAHTATKVYLPKPFTRPFFAANLILPGISELSKTSLREFRRTPRNPPMLVSKRDQADRIVRDLSVLHGGTEVLRYGDAPVPSPTPWQILIEVHAAGVNPRDWHL